jgi:hypothetical protein
LNPAATNSTTNNFVSTTTRKTKKRCYVESSSRCLKNNCFSINLSKKYLSSTCDSTTSGTTTTDDAAKLFSNYCEQTETGEI